MKPRNDRSIRGIFSRFVRFRPPRPNRSRAHCVTSSLNALLSVDVTTQRHFFSTIEKKYMKQSTLDQIPNDFFRQLFSVRFYSIWIKFNPLFKLFPAKRKLSILFSILSNQLNVNQRIFHYLDCIEGTLSALFCLCFSTLLENLC